ncbi:hypothetical protein HBB16_01800 [Pseudonocardia sp. MCCB 268]|nr:hypothetical protein [Pseudonocardia cytotoxica]
MYMDPVFAGDDGRAARRRLPHPAGCHPIGSSGPPIIAKHDVRGRRIPRQDHQLSGGHSRLRRSTPSSSATATPGSDAGVEQLSSTTCRRAACDVRVRYSSVNYKDGLACLPESPVVTAYPMVPRDRHRRHPWPSRATPLRGGQGGRGSDRSRTRHGAHFGGYMRYARLPERLAGAAAARPLPEEAMALVPRASPRRSPSSGWRRTASNRATAVLVTFSHRWRGQYGGEHAQRPRLRGGCQHEQVDEHEFLRNWAQRRSGREDVSAGGPIDAELWAGVIDPVGGGTLGYLPEHHALRRFGGELRPHRWFRAEHRGAAVHLARSPACQPASTRS